MDHVTEARPISEARSHFPALERWTYMDVAARGVLSREVRAAIDAHLDERMYDGYTDKDRWFALYREVNNHQTGHKTVLNFSLAESGVPAPEELFSTRTIERE